MLADWGERLEKTYKIEMNLQCGKAYMLLHDFPNAICSLRVAFSLVDQHRHLIQTQNCSFLFIRCFYETKDYDRALHAGEIAVAMNPYYDGVYRYIALTHRAMGNLELAIETMKKAAVYETPWDEKNKAVVRAQLLELLEERSMAEEGGG